MNPVVMPTNSPVEAPLDKGIASLESTSETGGPATFGRAILKPLKRPGVLSDVCLTESETSDSESSERPKSKARGSYSSAVPPLQKGAPLPKTSAELRKHRESSLGKGSRSSFVSSGKGSPHRSASVAPQIWAAQGNSQQTYQQLLRRGVPKAELDWWLQQGPLSWDYPFPEPNNLKVGIDWHNTLQKKRVRATKFPLTMSMHLNYSLRNGSRPQLFHTVGKREAHSFFFASCL